MKILPVYSTEPANGTHESMFVTITITKKQSAEVIDWLIQNRVSFSCFYKQSKNPEEVPAQTSTEVCLKNVLSSYSVKEDKIIAIIKTIYSQITGHISTKIPSGADIAVDFNVDPIKFKAVFKNMYKMPFYQYFIKHKMSQARELLESGNYSVKQISEMLGYTTPVKFVIIFKKYHNLTPGALKMMAKARKKTAETKSAY